MKPFLQEVAEDIVEKFGAQLQHCAIVFNNKRPAAYLQKYLADIIKKPFFSPAIFTIQEFFSEAVQEKTADFYLQFYTLLQVYNELLREEGLEPLSSHRFFPLAKIILSDFSQIDNDLVDADKLYRDLEDIAVINQEFDYLSPEQHEFLSQFWTSYSEGKHKKQQELFIQMWRRMPKLYHQFHARLKAQNFITNGYAYRTLANSDIVAVPFLQHFDQGKLIFVGFNALTSAEARLFAKLQEAGKSLFYFDIDSYYFNDSLQEAGLFLRKNISQLQLQNAFADRPSLMQNTPHHVDSYQIQGKTAQAKLLNHILADDYAQTDPIGTTAVILADESLLIPALQTIPQQVGEHTVNLNVTMGFPLGTSSVYGLADLWLSSQLEIQQEQQISYQQLAAFLTHPLTGLSQKMKDKVQTTLLDEKIAHIDYERLLKQKGLFEIFYQKVKGPEQVISQLLTVMDFLLNRLSTQKLLKKIDAELFIKTIQELNRLHDTIGRHIGQEEIAFVCALVKKALQGIAVPLSGDPLSGIQLMGLLETRNLNFDKIVFLGFNEGIIPKSTIGNSFIPDSIRRVYGLPVLENQDAISSYMVYRLLQRAKHISFVYNSLTDESNSGEVSRILKQLQYESNFTFSHYALSLNVKTELAKEIQIDKSNPAIQAVLQKYLNKERILSPSALTQYISNPIDFFFNYIAGIKEPKEVSAVVEANEVGSVLHKVMEYFYQDLKKEIITKELIQVKRKKVPALVQRAFAAVMFDNPNKVLEYSGMQKVILAIVEAYVEIILNQDEHQAPFQILTLEQKVEATVSFPLKGQEASVKIFGYIDRVDEKDGVVKIIDYKTGSDKLTFKDVPELFNSDGKYINKALVQTLLYTYVYEQYAGKTAVEPNLYVVKTMSQDGTWFKSGKQSLAGDYLEELKPQFLEELRKKLTELFEAPYFKASAVEDNYKYSIYKTLFGK